MKKTAMISISVTMVFILLGSAGIASAALINFDDLSQDSQTVVTDQYSDLGVLFENTKAINQWNYDHAPKLYPTNNVAVPYPVNYKLKYGPPTFIFDNVLSSFELKANAYLDGDGTGGNVLYLEAYDSDNNLLTMSEQTFTNGAWDLMSIDLTGSSATKIVLHDHGGYFGFDDINFNFVPIPSSILLLALGLVGLVGIRRKFRKS